MYNGGNWLPLPWRHVASNAVWSFVCWNGWFVWIVVVVGMTMVWTVERACCERLLLLLGGRMMMRGYVVSVLGNVRLT